MNGITQKIYDEKHYHQVVSEMKYDKKYYLC